MTHHTAKANLEKGCSWPPEAIPYGVPHIRGLVFTQPISPTPWTWPQRPPSSDSPLAIQLLIHQAFTLLVGTILCKFGQICATGNAFVGLIVGRNSILNFPAKIWTGMCRALLCGNDSSHSQSQSGKRLLLAFEGHPIRSLPQGWLLVPQWSEPTPWTRPQMPPGPKTPSPSDY